MKHLTSLVLGTNALHAFLKHANLYGYAFTALTITSFLLHTCSKDESLYHQTLFWLDQLALIGIFLVGAYYTAQIPLFQQTAAALSVVLVLIYYHYGRLTQQFCWDPQFGSQYHIFMHIAGSLGHHAILLGIA
jgi:hypothetical protein